MTAPHFFAEGSRALERGGRVTLSREDSRHALRALRLRPGEAVTVSDDDGTVASGRLAADEDGLAVIAVEEVRRVVRRGAIVSVALAPPKGDRLSWAVQKLGELGVDELVLVRTARTVREWEAGRAERAAERLRSVAREAAMQSRQPFVMRVLPAVPFDDAVAVRGGAVVLLWETADRHLHEVLPEEAAGVRLVVGPEGGFSPDEAERAVELGAMPASLGRPILRTETAAVVGSALVLARYGRLG